MPWLAITSKYWVVWASAASALSNVGTRLTPFNGTWSTPSITSGMGSPAASRTVGTISTTWVNCERRLPPLVMRFGQEITIDVRVPPRWEAIFLSHWNGVFIACAQPWE